MRQPLVTIIIPTFNRRRWIGECLDSVRAQTYPHIETLVVDDGSTDDTVDWLRSHAGYSFVKTHVQPKNGGASIARNTGIARAQGELIAFIDSDDRLAPNHVATAVEVLASQPAIGLFACDSTLIDSQGDVLYSGRTWHEIQSAHRRDPVQTGVRTLEDVFTFSHIFPGFTLPKTVFERVGTFAQSMFPMDDYDLMLRVAGAGYGIYYCHEPLASRREHRDQCSGPANAVETCRKQILALEAAVTRNPELRKTSSGVRRRMAQAQLELAVSRLKAGQRVSGLRTMCQACGTHPSQLSQIVRLASRRLRQGVTSA